MANQFVMIMGELSSPLSSIQWLPVSLPKPMKRKIAAKHSFFKPIFAKQGSCDTAVLSRDVKQLKASQCFWCVPIRPAHK